MRYSIITVCKNNLSGLEKTLASVGCQNYKDYEYIVIDGGSTDGSLEFLQSNNDKISYCVSEPDSGIYNGMNKGIKVAKGDYCLFLNSGDTFYSEDVLAKAERLLDTDFVCGDAMTYYDNPVKWIAPDSVNLDFWLKRFSICHQSVFIRTEILKERPYDESYRIVADYASFFYETVVNNRSYSHINLVVSNYGCDGVSSNHAKADKEKISVIDDFRQKGLIAKDELLELCKMLKVGTRRYNCVKALVKYLVK